MQPSRVRLKTTFVFSLFIGMLDIVTARKQTEHWEASLGVLR